jgi:hypothetical protein
MPLNFPSSSLTVGQLYEGWVWNGSAWDFVGRSVGITTTNSPTTTTTTAAIALPVVTLTGITQSNGESTATFTGEYSGSGITDTGFTQTATNGIPTYSSEFYFPADSTASPFSKTTTMQFFQINYYRAYAINDDGIGYSDAYPWSHGNRFMSAHGTAVRSGNNINCTLDFFAGAAAALNSEIDEIGFIFGTDADPLPTWETKEAYVLTSSQTIPSGSPYRVSATLTNYPFAAYARGYIKFNGGFYWYTLDSILVAETTTTTTTSTTTSTTTTSTSTTTTTTLPAGPSVTSFSLYTGYPSISGSRVPHYTSASASSVSAEIRFNMQVNDANGLEYGIVSSPSNTTPTIANTKYVNATVSGSGTVSLQPNGASDFGETWYFRGYVLNTGTGIAYYSSNVVQLRVPDVRQNLGSLSYNSGTQEITATGVLNDMLSGSPSVTAVGFSWGTSDGNGLVNDSLATVDSTFTDTFSVSSAPNGTIYVRSWANQTVSGQTIRVYSISSRTITKT